MVGVTEGECFRAVMTRVSLFVGADVVEVIIGQPWTIVADHQVRSRWIWIVLQQAEGSKKVGIVDIAIKVWTFCNSTADFTRLGPYHLNKYKG